MALRIRRGTDAQRSGRVFETGEIVWTTDGQQLWVGDGVTAGGVPVVSDKVAGYGLTYNAMDQTLEVAGLSADDLTNGVNNKFFSTELAQDAAASLFSTGSHTNIQFQYDDTLGKINATVTLDGIGITDVVNDTSPQLGGDLDLNSHDITGSGSLDITGNIDATGYISATGNITSSGVLSNGTISLNGSTISVEAGDLTVGTSTSTTGVVMQRTGEPTTLLTLKGLTDGPQASSCAIDHYSSRGTLSALAAVQPADALGLSSGWGHTGSGYLISSIVGHFVDPNDTVSATKVPGLIGFVTFPDNNVANAKGVFINRKGWVTIGRAIVDDAAQALDVNGNVKASLFYAGQQANASDFDNGYTFSGNEGGHDTGMFSPSDGIVTLFTNSVERVRVDGGGLRVNGFMKVAQVSGSLPNPPEAGMIVLDGTTFKGYNGSAWVDLN